MRLGDALQRARVCPLCDQLLLLERDGRFPEHGCRIVVSAPGSGQAPRKMLPPKAGKAGKAGKAD